MPREAPGYRETLAGILEFVNYRHMVSLQEAMAYTGFSDRRTLRKNLPCFEGKRYVDAAVMAYQLTHPLKEVKRYE